MKLNEKGFTLIEVIFATAITSIITLAAAMSVATLLNHTERCTDHTIVLNHVQNASNWISLDIRMAKALVLGESNGFPLSIDIAVDTDNSDDRSVVYLFDGDRLKRQLYDSSPTLLSESVVAEYIDSEGTAFVPLDTGVYKLTIKTTKGAAVVVTDCQIAPRVVSR